jgi:hypothetical protein
MKTSAFCAFLCGVAVMTVICPASAAVIVDSQGFESPTFAIDYLNGQNGFVEIVAAEGSRPEVVVGPDPELHGQAVRLQIPDYQGSNSGLSVQMADLINAGYTQVTVSFDIYRQTDRWNSNLWWYWVDNGNPTYGLQWDVAGGTNTTLPFGFASGAGSTPTIKDRWVNLTQTWNFITNEATSSYNGVAVDTAFPITGITSLTGWVIFLGHDEGNGSGSEVAWIDNFVITAVVPEPVSVVLLLAGGLVGVRHRMRRFAR